MEWKSIPKVFPIYVRLKVVGTPLEYVIRYLTYPLRASIRIHRTFSSSLFLWPPVPTDKTFIALYSLSKLFCQVVFGRPIATLERRMCAT